MQVIEDLGSGRGRRSRGPGPGTQPPARAGRWGQPVQGTLDELGTPLSQVTFVVVDLETTGGDPATSHITEIGAVKVCAGEVLGEFHTLIDPGEPIPAFIAVLTGITDTMVVGAPRITAVLPTFLDFARDAVLVAHNARFDVGFLKAAAVRAEVPWPPFRVLDTVHLARQLVTPDECPNHKLSSLAQLFGAGQAPDHRALHDARATVDVLHALIGRVGNLGVHSLEELTAFSSRVTPAQRRKRHLADHLPSAPGVYLFKDGSGRVLYVGTSTDIRRRVRSYFTSSEQRPRMTHMVALAATVTPVVCATRLEAQVRELRLIAEHDPRFNRRSRRPQRQPWLKLTVETFPRLSIVRQVRADGATYAGPFSSMSAAQEAVAALYEVLPLRQCLKRLDAARSSPACVLADIGRCGAPCEGRQTVADYRRIVEVAAAMLAGDCRDVVRVLDERMAALSAGERYEDAAIVRDRLAHLLRGCVRTQRIAPLAAMPRLVAARRAQGGGWEMVCVCHGRLTGTTTSPPGADPMPFVAALTAAAEVVEPAIAPCPAASADETELILGWLESDGTRLVELDGHWCSPAHGAQSAHALLDASPPWRRDVP